MVFRVPLEEGEEEETPGGNFTFGKAEMGVAFCGILLDCSRVRVKS